MNIFDQLKPAFKGDIDYSNDTLITYSRDASLFEIKPKAVLFPKDSVDVQTVVKFVNEHRKDDPTLSITARSAGTDMSGGAINASIILDFTRYMNVIKEITLDHGIVEPGCYYRNFEKETLKKNRIMPTYTASKEICAVGGMVANNSGGEKSLSIHSFLDGVALGLAFQVSSAVGAIVAIAILVHDFSDGINTVGFILKNHGNKKTAFKWLAVDAVAPIVGVISTFFFTLSEASLGIVLALFCGFFLYIGASDLIPESHHSHPRFLTTIMTVVGALTLFIAIKFAV